MHKTTRLVAWCVVLLAGTSTAHAQMLPWEDRGYISANFGLQVGSQTFDESATPVIYGENASLTVPHSVGGGPFFDVSVAVRVWGNTAIGVGYSAFSSTETATLTGQIPNPIVFNSPRPVSASTGELEHKETAIHVQFVYMIPMTNTFELALFAGPSFYDIAQDFVSNVGITEGPAPFGTVTVSSVETTSVSERAIGFTAGADGTFLFTRQLGAGVFLRYSGAQADLATIGGGTVSVSAGGLQFGFGARIRF